MTRGIELQKRKQPNFPYNSNKKLKELYLPEINEREYIKKIMVRRKFYVIEKLNSLNKSNQNRIIPRRTQFESELIVIKKILSEL